MAAILAVLYGSLLPFEFQWNCFRVENGIGLYSLSWAPTSVEDIVTNLLLYGPVGWIGARWSLQAKCRPALFLGTLMGFGVSLLAEILQSGIHHRVASWMDVTLNTVGSLGGAIIAVTLTRRVIQWNVMFRSKMSGAPIPLLTKLLALGLILFNLAPFDFLTTTEELHVSFLHTQWTLPGFGTGLSDGFGLMAWVDACCGSVWFAILGLLMARAARHSEWSPIEARHSAVINGALIAVLIEVLQLFLRSHVFEVLDVCVRIAFVYGGAVLGASAIRFRAVTAPVTKQALKAVVLGLALICLAWAGGWGQFSLNQIQWIPFGAAWRRPMAIAFADLTGTFAAFAAMAIALAWGFRRGGVQNVWPLTALILILTSGFTECFQAITGTGSADTTNIALALAAVWTLAAWDGTTSRQRIELPNASRT